MAKKRKRSPPNGQRRAVPRAPPPSYDTDFGVGSRFFERPTLDPRPGILLWSFFTIALTNELGRLVIEYRANIAEQYLHAAQYYPGKPDTKYWERKQQWNGIWLDLVEPNEMQLIARNGRDIRICFRADIRGPVKIDCDDLPPEEKSLRSPDPVLHSIAEIQAQAQSLAAEVVALVRRHVDPIKMGLKELGAGVMGRA